MAGEPPLNEAACPDGGAMREVYKDPGWGQVNLRTFPAGAETVPHRHPRTHEWWFLLRGRLHVTLEQTGRGPYYHWLRKGDQLAVHAGRGHAVRNWDDEEAVLLYWRDTLYDPEDPDKEPWEWSLT
jgi:quercetin dioxygenase-like cupin family protein